MKQKNKLIVVSPGNSKIGRIPNISVSPCLGCAKKIPCKKDCYALKAYRQYPDTRNAWNKNLQVLRDMPAQFFTEVDGWIKAKRKPPKMFRWFVSGDIGGGLGLKEAQKRFDLLKDIAYANRQTRFLLLTKYHALDFDSLPKNLTVVASQWSNWGNNKTGLPNAWLRDNRPGKTQDKRIPDNAIECNGNCEACGACWHLRDLKKDVVFNIH